MERLVESQSVKDAVVEIGDNGSSVYFRLSREKMGGELGYATLRLRNLPNSRTPRYYVENLGMHKEFSGQGLGSKLLTAIQDFLVERGAVGFLTNTAGAYRDFYDIKTRKKIIMKDIYKNNGWVQLNNDTGYWYYNLKHDES